MDGSYLRRGFLPEPDPLTEFPHDSEFSVLDQVGRDLPSLLEDSAFRIYAKQLEFPLWPKDKCTTQYLHEMHLYYVRMGFIASGYINQVGQEPVTLLPQNIAKPLCHIAACLNRPPILSYDGYALYNWKRFDKEGPIALGNIDTLQNFVHMYDEHWFILVHVEIEALAANIFAAIESLQTPESEWTETLVDSALKAILTSVTQQAEVLRRIPEKMDPKLYFKTFRQYIRFFENVVYEGINQEPIHFRGETGAQSSIMPILDALLKIPHEKTILTEHLEDMKNYMPAEDREIIQIVRAMPSLKEHASAKLFNEVLDAIAEFREIHIGWAKEYIQKWVKDPRGTGGTPYMKWLNKLIEETRAYKK